MREKHWGYAFLLPGLVVLLGISIFPLLYSLALSFCNWDIVSRRGISFIGLANYWQLIRDPEFIASIGFTCLLVLVATVAEFLLGLGLAIWFHRNMEKWELFKVVVICPVLISPIVVGAIWKMLYHPAFGLINYSLRILGQKRIEWLSDPTMAKLAIIIADIWQWTPFMFLILLSGLHALPKTPVEAAEIDGASRWAIFRFVTLPMLKPVMMVAILFRVVDLFKIFDKVYMLTRGGPAIATQTASMYVYFRAFRYFRIGLASAASFILLVLILIPILVMIKLLTPTR